MKTSVNEVDEAVGEEDEEWELKVVVGVEWRFIWGVVEFGVAFDFGGEAGSCQEGHAWHWGLCLFDFHADLILEVFGMFEGRLVENEDVGERCEEEV